MYSYKGKKGKGTSQRASLEIDFRKKEPSITTVKCLESGKTEEAFGDDTPSKKYALLMLTRNCSCGAKFHFVAPEDDD